MNKHYPLHIFQQLYIEFTNYCNYDCIFCINSQKTKQIIRLKDFIDFESLIQRANTIDITGYGEIILHPDFNEIVETLTKYNKKFSMSTNGVGLTKEKVDVLCNSPIYLLNISLNSLNSETYQKLNRNKCDLNIVLQNIEYLFTRKLNFNVKFSFVINNYNFNELENFINFANSHNKSWISFYDLTPTITSYPIGLKLNDTIANRQYLDKMVKYAKSLGLIINSFNLDMNVDNKKQIKLQECLELCHPPFDSFFIGANGNVTPCCWNHTIMGNITKQSLDEIWLGEKYNELRSAIYSGNSKFCQNCRLLG